LEVVAGIIFGLDSDSPQSSQNVMKFIETSNIPMLTINMLHALPKTPLWRRLEAANRLVRSEGRDSNIAFLLPYEQVAGMWRSCIEAAYTPEAIYKRFEYQIEHTYPNRKLLPVSRARLNFSNIRKGLSILLRLFWHVGICADYRHQFWRLVWPTLSKGKFEELIHTAVVSHHMILFARDCSRGVAEKCFYGSNAPLVSDSALKVDASPAPELVEPS
jgi:radical SAM superfamily enzyme YgiQ (UPF0313 family)